MIFSNEVTRIRPLLEAEINRSLAASYARTWTACQKQGGKSPQEPDYIADLSLNWITDFASVLTSLLSGRFKVGITGVYCHQKPLAAYGGSIDPEVGDLLVVLEYREQSVAPKFNALLLQAKSTASTTFQVGANDIHQLKLYEEWPKFKYKRAGALNGRYRDVRPKCINSGAKYLLIDPSYINAVGMPGHFGYGCAVPNKSIVLSKEFASEIIDFLTFNSGKTISERQSIIEDWSGMIWDLLEITKNAVSTRRNSRPGPFNRQTQSQLGVACFMAGNTSSNYLDDLEPSRFDGEGGGIDDGPNDDNGGVSVLYIRVENSQS